MDDMHTVLFTIDVIMLLWLSRDGVDDRVMRKGWGAIAVYAGVMIAGCLYFLWFLSERCGGCDG